MSSVAEDRTIVAAVGRPFLQIVFSDGRSSIEVLGLDDVRIGRSRDCGFVLDEVGVSRSHARIRLLDGQWIIEDTGSANGVYVNDSKTARSVLHHEDRLTLGSVTLTFHLAEAPPAESDDKTVLKRNIHVNRSRATKGGSAGSAQGRGASRLRAILIAAGIALTLIVLISFWAGNKSEPEPSARPDPGSALPTPFPDEQPLDVPAFSDAPPQLDAPAPLALPSDSRTEVSDENRALAARYAEAGQIYYDSGRLPDAVKQWSHALALDPVNEVTRIKLETTQEELLARADEAYRLGLRNYQFLNYDEAIRNWNFVLHLIPDPEHPLHQNAMRNMEQARLQMQR
ncbi:FHA domain-containing protein [Desulfonatronum thiodismutans]|uniref:FHA domain-containing protein n=1 Tax=Desulfonatronum thiodismutans TaxID=159290 RepID=UPI00068D6814|nr:FHA domain-containing protein [Desulfonatronum thiodismutans]